MNWYIGQPIVAILNHSQGKFKKGDEFTIKGLRQNFCNCKGVNIDVGICSPGDTFECDICNVKVPDLDIKHWFHEDCFAPVDVDISELTEIISSPVELTPTNPHANDNN